MGMKEASITDPKGSKRCKTNDFLNQSSTYQENYLLLLTEQNQHLAAISREMTMIRQIFCAVNNIQVKSWNGRQMVWQSIPGI